MGTIVITSRLGEEFRQDLEQLMFFNPKQRQAEADIKRCIELFGVPEITSDHGYLRISFEAYSVAQTFYSIDRTAAGDILAGAIVFVRNTTEELSILYIAIAETYIMQGPVITARLAWDLVRQVIDSASLISGVRTVKLAYVSSSGRSKAILTSIPVSKHTQHTDDQKNASVAKPVIKHKSLDHLCRADNLNTNNPKQHSATYP